MLDSKYIFVHPVRTRGTTINDIVFELDPVGCRISWQTRCRDWTVDELRFFLLDARVTFIHNHAGNWSEKTAGWFRDRGWRMMLSVRSVPDQLCSIWYAYIDVQKSLTLEQFIRDMAQGGNVQSFQWQIPAWAMDADVVIADPVQDLQNLFGVPFSNRRQNGSINPGWNKVVEWELVSKDTIDLVESCEYQQRYLQCLTRSGAAV